MKAYKNLTAAVLFALIFSVLFSFTRFESACADVRGSVLRLHILANSDSPEDQAIKLKVRDALLKEGENIFGYCENLENAEKLAAKNIDFLQKIAKKAIKNEGFDYPVSVFLGKAEFGTREYDKLTLPAGEYEAVRVIIGEGAGKNWWCVMFPPVCVPAAKAEDLSAVVGKEGEEITGNSREYVVKFKVIEIYEAIKSKFSKEK